MSGSAPPTLTAKSWTARRMPWAVALALLVLWPVVPITRGDPSVLADPLKYVLHHTGYAASLVLVVTLSLTPLLRVAGPRPWARGLQKHRRFLGVSAAVLALLHVGVHVLYEGGPGILVDNLSKLFLVAGMVALLILLVLAVTSADRLQRALGHRWKKLHRLAYVAVALVAYHQVAAHKLFPVEVLWIFGPWLALQAWRLILARKTRAA